MINIDDDVDVPSGSVESVVNAVERMRLLEEVINKTEDFLKETKAKYNNIAMVEIPDLMDSVGVKKLTLSNGDDLKIEELLLSSIPSKSKIEEAEDDEKPQLEQRLHDAIKWLREHNAESLIKNKIQIEFSKGQDNIVGDIVGTCQELGLPYKREESIHPKTLSKYLKEQLEAGVSVPNDTFAIQYCRKAVVKKAKK